MKIIAALAQVERSDPVQQTGSWIAPSHSLLATAGVIASRK
jgi:hypothetical protein